MGRKREVVGRDTKKANDAGKTEREPQKLEMQKLSRGEKKTTTRKQENPNNKKERGGGGPGSEGERDREKNRYGEKRPSSGGQVLTRQRRGQVKKRRETLETSRDLAKVRKKKAAR